MHAAHGTGVREVSIRIVAGAVIELAYFDRDTNADIDAQIAPMEKLVSIVEKIVRDRGWPGWLPWQMIGLVAVFDHTDESVENDFC